MTKVEMIERILGCAKSAALLQNKPIDLGDLFFSLIFRSEKELMKLCKALNVA